MNQVYDYQVWTLTFTIDDTEEMIAKKIQDKLNEMAEQGYRFMFIARGCHYYFERIV